MLAKLLRCQNWVNGYEYFNLEQRTRLSFHIHVSFHCFINMRNSNYILGTFTDTPLHRHQKHHISLVDISPKKSSLNSKMMLGENRGPCESHEMDLHQSYWMTKSWSLVVTLSIKIFPATLKLKSGTLKMKNIRWSRKVYQTDTFGLVSVCILYLSIFAPPKRCCAMIF